MADFDIVNNKKILNDISTTLDKMLLNEPFESVNTDCYPDDFKIICEKINMLGFNLQELNTTLVELSKGNLDIDLPPRKNYIASAIKQLYSNLNHLTWQTERIASGDYSHKVNFMGHFSNAFNTMTFKLEERERQLYSTNKILETVFNYIDPLIIINADNRNIAYFINDCAKDVFNLNVTMSTEGFYDLKQLSDSVDFLKKLLNVDINQGSILEISDKENEKWYCVNAAFLKWLDNNNAIILYCSDISIQKNREVELEKNAHTDALTGLFNRFALDLTLAEEWKLAKINNTYLSIMIIDIDNFKAYNDTYGHMRGDICLFEVANCIKSSAICPQSFVSRFGGEEFIVLMPNTSAEKAFKAAETIRKNVQTLIIKDNSDKENSLNTNVTVSIGVATINPKKVVASETEFLTLSDKALYSSKENGRNKTTLFKFLKK